MSKLLPTALASRSSLSLSFSDLRMTLPVVFESMDATGAAYDWMDGLDALSLLRHEGAVVPLLFFIFPLAPVSLWLSTEGDVTPAEEELEPIPEEVEVEEEGEDNGTPLVSDFMVIEPNAVSRDGTTRIPILSILKLPSLSLSLSLSLSMLISPFNPANNLSLFA